MVSKVVTKEVPGLTMDEIKEKLVQVFETAFNERVENDDIDLSEFSEEDNIVEDVTNSWSDYLELEGILTVAQAFGFTITGSIKREVTFQIQ